MSLSSEPLKTGSPSSSDCSVISSPSQDLPKSGHPRSSNVIWTPEEDEKLRVAVILHKEKNWKKIAQTIGTKTPGQCSQRWRSALNPDVLRIKGRWTPEEDAKLIELVKKYGTKNWRFIASHLRGRLPKQCRERWYNQLDPTIKKDSLSAEEWDVLKRYHEKLGNRWSEISKYIPGRTANQLKNHWNTMLRRLAVDQGKKRKTSSSESDVDNDNDDDNDDSDHYSSSSSSGGSADSKRCFKTLCSNSDTDLNEERATGRKKRRLSPEPPQREPVTPNHTATPTAHSTLSTCSNTVLQSQVDPQLQPQSPALIADFDSKVCLFSKLDILAYISALCDLAESPSCNAQCVHNRTQSHFSLSLSSATTIPNLIPLNTPIQAMGEGEGEERAQAYILKEPSATPSYSSSCSPKDHSQRVFFSEGSNGSHNDIGDALPPISALINGITYYFPQYPSNEQTVATRMPTIQFLTP
jgi:hypothetical protein